MNNSILSLIDIRYKDNIIETIALELDFGTFIFTSNSLSKEKAYSKDNKRFIVIPELPELGEINELPSSETIKLLNPFKDIIIKVILRFHHINIKPYKNQIYSLDSIYYKYLFYVEKLITKENVQLIIFGEPPHLPMEYILHLLVEKKIINGIYFHYINQLSLVKNYYLISNSFNRYSDDHYNYMESISKLNISELETMLTNPFDLVYSKSVKPKVFFEGANKLNSNILKHYYFKFNNSNKKLDSIKDFFLNRLLNQLNRYNNRMLLNRYKPNGTFKDFDAKKYVFFPLHFQPEATTLPHGGIFDNQLLALNFLLDNLNPKIHIVVKEHPAYFMFTKDELISDYRNKEFYKYINSSNRIIFVNPNEDSSKLIKYSLCVATITGTVAFEALLENKVCLLFGDSIYSQLPNVINPIEHTEELSHKLGFEEKKDDISYRKKLLIYLNMIQNFSKNFSLPRSFLNKKNLVDKDLNINLLVKEIVENVKNLS